MNEPNNQMIAQAVGQVVGELLNIVVALTNALRQQPGFDEDGFRAQLETLLEHPNITDLQRHAFTTLLETPGDDAGPGGGDSLPASGDRPLHG